MVFGVVTNEGHAIPPHFFHQCLKINADYINVLKTAVKPWTDGICNARPYVFQQDSAPSHKAMLTQKWMSDNLHDHVIPDM